MISKERIDQISKEILERNSFAFENGSATFGIVAYKILSDRQRAIKPVDENESKDKIGYYIEPNYLFEKVVQRDGTNSENWKDAFEKFGECNPLLKDVFEPNLIQLRQTHQNSLDECLAGYDLTTYSVAKASYLFERLLENSHMDFGKRLKATEVSLQIRELVAKLLNTDLKQERVAVFDPVSRSGSLLLTIKEKLSAQVDLYGEEILNDSLSVLKMNMLIHGMDVKNIQSNFKLGDFLEGEAFDLKRKFDVISMTPPLSRRWNADPNLLKTKYFADAGVLPPKSKADYAYILKGLQCLVDTGTMVAILPTGVLFRSTSEEIIRKYLLENKKIYALISLPKGVWYGTQISTVLMVFKQKCTDNILFIDASRDGVKNTIRLKQNVLTEEGFNKILHTYRNREEVDRYSRLVSLDEIRKNGYNLNIMRYIDTFSEKKIDVEATMSSLSAKHKVIEKSKKELIKLLNKLDTPEARQAIKAVSVSE